MATFQWSALTNGQSLTFNPTTDVLNFDDTSISAGAITSVSYSSTTAGPVTLTIQGKSVTLSCAVAALTTTNVTFADGSRLFIGDNTTGTSGDSLGNTLNGTANSDSFFGLAGADTLNGGDGNDTFFVSFQTNAIGNDIINGGNGFDTLIYNASSTQPVSVNLSGTVTLGIAAHTAINSQGTLSLTSIETVFGTSGNDRFVGGDAAHAIGSSGDRISERFRGNAGNDTIIGGAGIDFFTTADYANNSSAQAVVANLATGVVTDGRGGTDSLTNVDSLRGGDAADFLTGGSLSRAASGFFFEMFRGNAGNDVIDGNDSLSDGSNASVDRADYSNNTSSEAINVDLSTGLVNDGKGGTDTLIDIDQVFGGAGNDVLLGGALDDTFDGGVGNDILNGGSAGSDQGRFEQSTSRVIVNLSSAAITVGAVTVAAGTANDGMGGTDTLISIEAIDGTDFDDFFRGSDNTAVREFFRGNGGNDTINGGAGIDFASYIGTPLTFGGLTATISGGSGTVTDGWGGTDTLTNIEGLTGTNSSDTLSGGVGTQWFRGAGGSDTINGGADNDWVTYETDLSNVTVNLATGLATDGWNGPSGLFGLGGTDTLISIENVEGSLFGDTITGNAVANELKGLDGIDILVGGAGNDTLSGGTGADLMSGQGDNDLYLVDNAADVVLEAEGGGVDRVSTTVTYALRVGSEVERVDAAAGTAAINLNGNEFNQALNGNNGANVLNGKGGADVMTGFGGNDTYVVDDIGDVVIEAVGGGVDRIDVSFNFALRLGSEIERLDAAAGTAAINLNGNEFNQALNGNNGSNVLNGRGGADVMTGFGGNDIYIVDNTGDVVTEAVGGGVDRIDVAFNFALRLGSEIERLDAAAGTAAISLTGNEFGQSLNGNAGANILNGRLGNDVMSGGLGADIFEFNTTLNAATNVDIVSDFSVVDDSFRLENGIFTQVGPAGTLAAAAFVIGSAAADANDRIIYNSATGTVSYDADGSGAGASAIAFARVAAGLSLTENDFLII